MGARGGGLRGWPRALKVLEKELSGDEGNQRFQAEIRTTATLNHPGILPLFDSGPVDGHPVYVMPVVEGEALQARLDRERSLTPAESGRIAAAAARALAHAHERGGSTATSSRRTSCSTPDTR